MEASPRDEEREAMEAIFGEDLKDATTTLQYSCDNSLSISTNFTHNNKRFDVSIHVRLPKDYPHSKPRISLHSKTLHKSSQNTIRLELQKITSACAKEERVVIFDLCTELQSLLEEVVKMEKLRLTSRQTSAISRQTFLSDHNGIPVAQGMSEVVLVLRPKHKASRDIQTEHEGFLQTQEVCDLIQRSIDNVYDVTLPDDLLVLICKYIQPETLRLHWSNGEDEGIFKLSGRFEDRPFFENVATNLYIYCSHGHWCVGQHLGAGYTYHNFPSLRRAFSPAELENPNGGPSTTKLEVVEEGFSDGMESS